MGITHALADGEHFVEGRSEAKAKELLALAEAAGLPGQVSTTSFGYIVPAVIFASDVTDVDPAVLAALEAEKAAVKAQEDTAAAAAADENPEGVQFDPSTTTVDGVKEYLAGADDEERARVLAAEAASDTTRKGVLDLATIPEGDK
ncbi:MAG TPA: hypothetical protein DEP82_14555 [Arthrobacter bacterium]|nr:hypothetical protein [Arthrobacter sp.]